MKIGICSDHAGFAWKSEIIHYLSEKGYEIVDFGTHSIESMDYPDVAHLLGQAVANGDVEKGIAMCGTGNGMGIKLNKYPQVRDELVWKEEIAALVKQHNNANVLVMPARFSTFETALKMLDIWMDTEFEGGRHQKRIDKIPIQH